MEWGIAAAASLFVALFVYNFVNSLRDVKEQVLKKENANIINLRDNEIDDLREENTKLENKILALKSRIKKANSKLERAKHLNQSLLGEIWEKLIEARESSPAWLENPEDFIMLAPAGLIEVHEWSSRAAVTWKKIERLSPNSRRVIEEVCVLHTPLPADSDEVTLTPLLKEAVAIVSSKPKLVQIQLFHTSADELTQFSVWISLLVAISREYVFLIWKVSNLRDQIETVFDEN